LLSTPWKHWVYRSASRLGCLGENLPPCSVGFITFLKDKCMATFLLYHSKHPHARACRCNMLLEKYYSCRPASALAWLTDLSGDSTYKCCFSWTNLLHCVTFSNFASADIRRGRKVKKK
jgi:hypothetical protein